MTDIKPLVNKVFSDVICKARSLYDIDEDPYFDIDCHLVELVYSFDEIWNIAETFVDPVDYVKARLVDIDSDARLLSFMGDDCQAMQRDERYSDILNGFMSTDEERKRAARGLLRISIKAQIYRDVLSYKGEKIC